MANSVNPDQTAPIGVAVLGPHVLLVYLNSPIMFGKCLQQTTSADDIFRCIFHGALRVKPTESFRMTYMCFITVFGIISNNICLDSTCLNYELYKNYVQNNTKIRLYFDFSYPHPIESTCTCVS